MRILDLMKKELLYGGLSKTEFQQVRKPVAERNRKLLIAWSIISGLFWIATMLLYNTPEYAQAMIVLRAALIASALTCACALLLAKRFPQALLPSMYFWELSFLGTAIGLSFVQPDVRIAAMVALPLIVTVSFIDRTVATVAIEAIAFFVYAAFGKDVLFPDVYAWGVKSLAIFCVAGIITGHTINKARFERYLYADSAKKLADLQKAYSEELERDVEAKTEQIVALNDKLVMGMATMVESRDNSTGGHIRRTSEGVRILTDEMRKGGSFKLPDEFCDKLVKAAPMHDLGKIAVDDAILRKPGRFTPEEYEKMKAHAAEGARVVREILADTDDEEFRRIAENIAHYHHERVDGSGYPNGLRGDEIPLEARIMAIADVYDALVSKRVYKESYSFKKADKIILEGMGTQFDPLLREYYEAARPKLEAYYAQG